jgi:uncharacterized membrane protein
MRKVAWLLLVFNALVVLFSVAGFGVFISGLPKPAWNYYALTQGLSIANVVSGVLCALLAMASEQGWRPTLVLLALATTVAGTMELIGTTTGVPFGHYQYTELLGYKLFGHVPLLIPPSWFMMLYPALLLASLRLRGWLARAAVAAAVLTLWDVALDAACTAGFAQWQWLQQGSLWGWLPEVHFYGMPLENWLGWLLTGGLISALFLRVQPDWKPTRHSIGIWLYLVQGALAAMMALLLGRGWASLLWLVGMAAVLLWLRPWSLSTARVSVKAE